MRISHEQTPPIINFGKDSPIYKLQRMFRSLIINRFTVVNALFVGNRKLFGTMPIHPSSSPLIVILFLPAASSPAISAIKIGGRAAGGIFGEESSTAGNRVCF
jgi:hypothetical protein